jgi:rhodanese-related sulfurtransferase
MNGYMNIDVEQLQAMRKAGNVRLIDVRTEAEIARGYIEGAEKLPLHLLPLRLNEFSGSAPTVFYCQSGGRSGQAAAFVAAQGVAEVYNLQGGIMAWARAGMPIAG